MPGPAAGRALRTGLLSEQVVLTYDAKDKAGVVSDRDGADTGCAHPGDDLLERRVLADGHAR